MIYLNYNINKMFLERLIGRKKIDLIEHNNKIR